MYVVWVTPFSIEKGVLLGGDDMIQLIDLHKEYKTKKKEWSSVSIVSI